VLEQLIFCTHKHQSRLFIHLTVSSLCFNNKWQITTPWQVLSWQSHKADKFCSWTNLHMSGTCHLYWSRHCKHQVQLLSTSNVTGRHQDPKRKLRAGYRAPSLQRTSYRGYCSSVWPVVIFIVQCGIANFLCACMSHVRIRHSGIILIP